MAGVREVYFDTGMARDFFDVFAGKELGAGVARRVFEHAQDPSLVIKFEVSKSYFQNSMEWEVWSAVRDNATTLKKWFAPCVAISPCGMILIQKRTQEIRKNELPKRIPSFFSDLKRQNWGLLDGRPVAHDYGVSMILHKGLRKEMQTADWWEGE